MENQVETTRAIALDIEDIIRTPRGAKFLNAFLSSSAELFKTKRGRLALLVKIDIFDKLQRQLNLVVSEGLDGTFVVAFKAEP